MLPELQGGDFVIATRFYWRINVGDLLIINHHRYGKIIKRIINISAQHGISLTSDNLSEGITSEQIGWINKDQIHGKVFFCIKQPAH